MSSLTRFLTATRLAACFLLALLSARAQVEGPQGHFYKVVVEPGLTWEEAKTRAAEATFNGVHGYLATITSAAEDEFIEMLRAEAAPGGEASVWVGGSQLPDAASPGAGWFWENGEGPIPTTAVEGVYANWQSGEPDDYWGAQSERYLSVGHFNQFGWNDESNGRPVNGYVIEFPSGGRAATVKVATIDAVATEDPNTDSEPDVAIFEFSREGGLELDLPVFYSVHGTASNGFDYNEISKTITIPAGKTSVRLTIVPRADVLAVVEKMETVGIRLEPSLILTPSAAYNIDPDQAEAAAVIYETRPPERGALEIAVPRSGSSYREGEPITILAAAYRTPGIMMVEFFADGGKIGQALHPQSEENLRFFKFTWQDPPVGAHVLTARASSGSETQLQSSEIGILVRESETSRVSIRFVEPQTEEPYPSADYAPGYVEVTRTGPLAENLQVFFTVSGTATAEVDYERLPAYVVIGANRATAKITVLALDDQVDESNETVVFTLIQPDPAVDTVEPSHYTIDPDHKVAEVVILDNDPLAVPLVRVEAADPSATERANNSGEADSAFFVISRLGDISGPLEVFFSVHGTATPGEDYEQIPRSVTIPANRSSVTIPIQPRSDADGFDHQYEIISEPGLNWEQARIRAEQSTRLGVHGHLATITSSDEDARIEALRLEAGAAVLWVGGYQEPSEESIRDGWKWVNGEGSFPGRNDGARYAHWLPDEPNDYWGAASENYLVIGWGNSSGWNDQGANVGAQGYVVEYEIPTPAAPVTEGMETVGIVLRESPAAALTPSYDIDAANRMAAAVILEHEPPAGGAIEVAVPGPNDELRHDDVQFLVTAFPVRSILEVEYLVDGHKVGVSSEPENIGAQIIVTYIFKWKEATPGQHFLQARAKLPNEEVMVSSEIRFFVGNNAPNDPPVARVTHPADGESFLEGAEIPVRAEASDDNEVARLELLLDGEVIATAEKSVIEFTLRDVAAGTHLLNARATDDLGVTGVSAGVRILVRHREAVAFVHRNLPESYAPGVAFVVELRCEPPAGAVAYAVEDTPPAGWRVSEISDDGAFDSFNRKVKFGPFTDSTTRTLTYRLLPPAAASGPYEFSGASSLNGALYPIVGEDSILPAQKFHPADRNESFSIALAEVTTYTAAWKNGQSWPTGPVPIPMSYVTSAHTIWKRGETYTFDPSRGPAPACWIPADQAQIRAFAQGVIAAQRNTDGGFTSASANPVEVVVKPAAGTSAYAVEEKPPRDWIVSQISHDGKYDPVSGAIRWGVFSDATARTLTYSLTAPPGVSSVGGFSGRYSADGKIAEIQSSGGVTVNSATPIQITECRRDAAGVTLRISGPSGQTAVLESSEDFRDWSVVKSIFVPGGSVECADESAPQTRGRFYRLRVE